MTDKTNTLSTVAAVDLGSNSFHMIVAQLRNDELHMVDKLKHTVRLAAGLDENRYLTDEAQHRALACLRRFGQRLTEIPQGRVRAVGTETLRSAHNSEAFLIEAEKALGHPIEIISGVEEARLIHLGVAHSIASDDKRRLVMDIGGSSTELIIGKEFIPFHMQSLRMGCVNMSKWYFGDGKITEDAVKRAEMHALRELEPVQAQYLSLGWEACVGASGTIRAIRKIVLANCWSLDGITLESLNKIVKAMLKAGDINKLKLPGLSSDRAPVFPGGVLVLLATFKALGIDRMRVSDGALREGLLHDLLGRIYHEDVRGRTVEILAKRYGVDQQQAERVKQTALNCLCQAADSWPLDPKKSEQLLGWAADVHEIGLSIAHSQHHQHAGYIIEHGDLPGFSRQEQKILAALVRSHRRKLAPKHFQELSNPWRIPAQRLSILLRLAVLLHRSRSNKPIPMFMLKAGPDSLDVAFPENWLNEHPLTRGDLEQEATYLKSTGFSLTFG